MRKLRTPIRLLVSVFLTAILLVPTGANAAYVLATDIGGTIYQATWEVYYTQRTTNAYPYNISFGKSDGPGISLRYYSCGASAWRGEQGSGIYFSDPDDGDGSDEHQRIRYGPNWGSYTLTFCLSAYSAGSDPIDTFSGELAYWRA